MRRSFAAKVRQRLAEDLGERVTVVRGGLLDAVPVELEGSGRVELGRAGVGRAEALALLRVDVQQHRVIHLAQGREQLDQRLDVVAVDRAEVRDVHALEQLARRQGHADALLELLHGLFDALADAGQVFEDVLGRPAQVFVRVAEPEPREVLGNGPDGRVDGHAVVVEHDQKLPLDEPEVVQGLERAAVDDAGVPDDGDDLGANCGLRIADCGLVRGNCLLFAGGFQLLRQGHSDGRCDRRAGVAHHERVVRAFLRVGKTADAASLTEFLERHFAAGDDLVRVALVAYVPKELVLLEIEGVVQGEGRVRPRRGCWPGARRSG